MKTSPIIPRTIILGVTFGLIAGIFFLLLMVRWLWGDPTPQLSLDAYLNAVETWNDEAPRNYDIEIEVRGSQPGSYRVEVRNDEARGAYRNGIYLPQRRSHATWSVDGMFATLAQDVARLEQAQRDGSGDPFSLRVFFDPQYGFPAKYRRSEYSFPIEVEWNVIQFTPVPPGTPLSAQTGLSDDRSDDTSTMNAEDPR